MKRVDTAIYAELGEITVKDLVMSESGSLVSIKNLGREQVMENGE